MAINEVFPNPTVKEVHFQIRFPSLFYMEKKIGDLQLELMEKFPVSSFALKQQIIFADLGSEVSIEQLRRDHDGKFAEKTWIFKSEEGVEIHVFNSSLGILSRQHKTYDKPGPEEQFRNLIEYVVSRFLKVISIPVINRIGLRYIDECPIADKTNEIFQEWYKTTFPLTRFNLADATEMCFKTTVKKDDCFLRYLEEIVCHNDIYSLKLDFDGYKNTIEPTNYLSVSDTLHRLISDEYEASINEPVFKYMRQKRTE